MPAAWADDTQAQADNTAAAIDGRFLQRPLVLLRGFVMQIGQGQPPYRTRDVVAACVFCLLMSSSIMFYPLMGRWCLLIVFGWGSVYGALFYGVWYREAVQQWWRQRRTRR